MRLIDAEVLKSAIIAMDYLSETNLNFICKAIDNAPTVEPFERIGAICNENCGYKPQGEWIKHIDNLFPEESTEECPFCHEEQILIGNDDNFCPNCGADMRKENKDNGQTL